MIVTMSMVGHRMMPGISPETMLAKISSEMPLPMPRWLISSPMNISSVVPAVSVITIS